uniref:Uncharacterized protein n=1 Tax=Megaviridae environmental sample TaxID=1737588 RepID=A0A5J6VJW8_9VIRU|nr:MAG: hypothetical protein [Megaviridae environmental sample]
MAAPSTALSTTSTSHSLDNDKDEYLTSKLEEDSGDSFFRELAIELGQDLPDGNVMSIKLGDSRFAVGKKNEQIYAFKDFDNKCIRYFKFICTRGIPMLMSHLERTEYPHNTFNPVELPFSEDDKDPARMQFMIVSDIGPAVEDV